MSVCPAEEQLQLLIDDQVPPAVEQALTAHIDRCSACQERLEQLTRGADLSGTEAPDVPDASAALVERWTQNAPRTPERWPQVTGYEIVGELGQGGMGVVYRAWQRELKRTVALKMIRAGLHADPRLMARFRTEAEAAARLQHPHIVQVYDVGEHDGCPYLVLEYLAGGNLARKINGTPQPALPAARLAEMLARAVHHAHQHEVVHRDLKPANVLLTEEGVPKVTDFGLAKLVAGGATQTQSGEVMGTPSYMAPEQAAGKTRAAGPAADVYALGAILYELLTGRPPFQAETPLETVWQVVHEEPVSVTRLQPKVPCDLETICLKCLQKDPGKRYRSAEALADDLGRFLAGEPVRARPVGAWERGVKWARRRPALAASAAISLAATLALIAGGAWYNTRLRDEVRHRRVQQRHAVAHLQTALDVLEHQLTELHDAQQRGYAVPAPLRADLLEHAVAFYQKLLAEADDVDPQVRRAIGRAYLGLGLSSLMQRGDEQQGEVKEGLLRQTEAYYREAVKVQEELLAGEPDRADYRIDLATTLLRLMDLQRRGPEYYRNRTRMVALVQTLPPDESRLADMGALVAQELVDRDRLRKALPWLDQHIKHLETLRGRTQPGLTLEVMNRAVHGMYVTRAVILDELRDYPHALAAWDQVLALGEVPGVATSPLKARVCRALALAHLGDHEQAIREVDQALGPTVRDGEVLWNAAAVYSLAAVSVHQDDGRPATEQASREEQYASRAVELLRRTQAGGYLTDPALISKLQADPDFASVRSRDDFKKLLADVQQKAR